MKKRLPTILITALVTVLICSLFSHFSGPKGIADLSAEDSAFLEKFHTLKEYIDQYAIYDFDEKFAKDAAHLYYMTGIKDDAYAYYFTKEELQDYNTETQGSFVGIGINVMTQTTVLENGLYIYRVVGGSPAEAAGLMTGDVIVEADGVSFINYPYEDAVDVLLDEEGTTAELVVERNGERKSFSVTRKTFEQRNVEYNIYDNLGYIRIYQFAENADEQFQQALNTLLSKNVDGIIFDVRNNPGGELNTVCSMIDMLQFLGFGSFNSKQLHINICHIHCSALYRKSADLTRINTHAVNETGHLNTGVLGKICDKSSSVQNVSAYLIGSICNDSFHYSGCIFKRALMLLNTAFQNFFIFLLPALNLADTASWIFVKRNVVFLDKFGIF